MNLWYPYAQMKTMPAPVKVERAEGCELILENGLRVLDAISSWWCVIHGYNHPKLNQAAIEQIHKMSHVMLGGLSHEPAQKLAVELARILPGELNHVFFADSGSVGVEVALKMALQFHINKGVKGKTKFCSLRMGYHGDTLTAMSVGDPDDAMHDVWQGALVPQFWVRRPEAENIDVALFELEEVLMQHHQEIAAFICEPILQSWGGFNYYSPEYLKQAKKLCDHYGVLTIYDEVATGFGRTGKMFAMEHAQIEPDIVVLSKALTGGYLGLSATVANQKVYDAFYGDESEKALMHGPTFMGNPLACNVALSSIKIFEEENYLIKIQQIENWFKEEFNGFKSSKVVAVRITGASLCLEVSNPSAYQGIREFALERGVWLRPFVNYVYSMPAYVMNESQIKKICAVIKEWFRDE